VIRVTVDKTTVLPGEIVTFTGYADPLEDIRLDAYVGGSLKAIYTIYLKTLGIDTLSIIPSMLGDVVVFQPTGVESGAKADPITITVTVAPPAEYKLTLSASKTRDILPGEVVTFVGTSEPPANLRAALYAYVSGRVVGIYGFSIVNGYGSAGLVPSELGNVVDWKLVDEYGDESNTVTTYVVVAPVGRYSLSLSASKTENLEPDEVVEFTLVVSPKATYAVQLKAFVKDTLSGVWNINVIDGVGRIGLVPGRIGDIVDWVAEDEYGDRSNKVTTYVKGAKPPTEIPSWLPFLVLGGLAALALARRERE
jgi:hypothetical protein